MNNLIFVFVGFRVFFFLVVNIERLKLCIVLKVSGWIEFWSIENVINA